MTLTLLKQTRNSNCGQTAMAMVTGIDPRQIEKEYGTKAATRMGQHIAFLIRRGYLPPTFTLSDSENKGQQFPALGLMRIAPLKMSGGHLSGTKTKNMGHIVAIHNGIVYDPSGRTYPAANIVQINGRPWKVTHIIPLVAKSP